MAEGFKEQIQQPHLSDLSFEERFGLLVDRQFSFREDYRLQRPPKEAKLKIQACPEDLEYKSPRGIDKSVILHLLSGDWIQKHKNVIIAGPTGVGKTLRPSSLSSMILVSPPLSDPERRDLLEVIKERNGSGSTLVTSQLPVENWHEYIGNPTIADAILDRLIHNAHPINLKGSSMRKKFTAVS